jgi:hypothetical protein
MSFEKTLGSRLRKFKNMILYIVKWAVYKPALTQDSVENLQLLAKKLEAGNKANAANEKRYKDAVNARQLLFRKEPYSIQKILRLIRGAMLNQYKKNSSIYIQVSAMIKELRSTKLIKPPADPSNPENAHTISQSQQSYGSLTQGFSNIVTKLSEQGDYTSDNPELTIPGLVARVQLISQANDDVANTLKDISDSRDQRNIDYEEMDAKIMRIKAYALSKYGVDSKEYKEIMSEDK